jgi:putative sterol carrier protein
MPVFPSTEVASEVFGKLFTILSEDAEFSARLKESGLIVRLQHSNPTLEILMGPGTLEIGEQVEGEANITIKMSCDTAHKLWLGTLLMPAAIATGKVRIRGKVAKVLELVPILRPAFDRYPEIAAAQGLPV